MFVHDDYQEFWKRYEFSLGGADDNLFALLAERFGFLCCEEEVKHCKEIWFSVYKFCNGQV
jgi:hypothetical protein